MLNSHVTQLHMLYDDCLSHIGSSRQQNPFSQPIPSNQSTNQPTRASKPGPPSHYYFWMCCFARISAYHQTTNQPIPTTQYESTRTNPHQPKTNPPTHQALTTSILNLHESPVALAVSPRRSAPGRFPAIAVTWPQQTQDDAQGVPVDCPWIVHGYAMFCWLIVRINCHACPWIA